MKTIIILLCVWNVVLTSLVVSYRNGCKVDEALISLSLQQHATTEDAILDSIVGKENNLFRGIQRESDEHLFDTK